MSRGTGDKTVKTTVTTGVNVSSTDDFILSKSLENTKQKKIK